MKTTEVLCYYTTYSSSGLGFVSLLIYIFGVLAVSLKMPDCL